MLQELKKDERIYEIWVYYVTNKKFPRLYTIDVVSVVKSFDERFGSLDVGMTGQVMGALVNVLFRQYAMLQEDCKSMISKYFKIKRERTNKNITLGLEKVFISENMLQRDEIEKLGALVSNFSLLQMDYEEVEKPRNVMLENNMTLDNIQLETTNELLSAEMGFHEIDVNNDSSLLSSRAEKILVTEIERKPKEISIIDKKIDIPKSEYKRLMQNTASLLKRKIEEVEEFIPNHLKEILEEKLKVPNIEKPRGNSTLMEMSEYNHGSLQNTLLDNFDPTISEIDINMSDQSYSRSYEEETKFPSEFEFVEYVKKESREAQAIKFMDLLKQITTGIISVKQDYPYGKIHCKKIIAV